MGATASRDHVDAQGKLSFFQVRALSRVATPELEGQLLELTRYSTAAQLERVLRAYRGVLARELTPEELEHGERYLTCEHDVDGPSSSAAGCRPTKERL
jgi:hypothetical protein